MADPAAQKTTIQGVGIPETITIDGRKKTALAISSASASVPPSVRNGRGEPGTFYDGKAVHEWYWQGFTQLNGKRYIYFEPMEILPLQALYSMPWNEAFERIAEIAELMRLSRPGVFLPADAIFLVAGRGILLLPRSIIEMQITGKSAEEVRETSEQWIRPGFRGEGTSVYLLTEYLYRLLTGHVPLGDEDSRDDSYTPLPPHLLNQQIPEKESRWIQNMLTAKSVSDLPDIDEWIRQFNTRRKVLVMAAPPVSSPLLDSYLISRAKRVKRKRFLRKRGTLIMGLGAAAVMILLFAISMITRALEPPQTAGLEPEEMIAVYYQSQNDLDTELLNDTLDRGVRSEAENMVTNLFVTSRTRLAYEQNDGIFPAQEWLDQGRPPVEPGTIVYGITSLELTQIDDFTFRAEYDFWLPDSGSDSEEDAESGIGILKQHIVEELDVRQEKDYWLITEIRRISIGSEGVE